MMGRRSASIRRPLSCLAMVDIPAAGHGEKVACGCGLAGGLPGMPLPLPHREQRPHGLPPPPARSPTTYAWFASGYLTGAHDACAAFYCSRSKARAAPRLLPAPSPGAGRLSLLANAADRSPTGYVAFDRMLARCFDLVFGIIFGGDAGVAEAGPRLFARCATPASCLSPYSAGARRALRRVASAIAGRTTLSARAHNSRPALAGSRDGRSWR